MNFIQSREVGLLAQEVNEVIPNAVVKNTLIPVDSINREEAKYLGVDYVALIPYLISAIQDQQLLIENQGKLIESLLQGDTSKVEESVIPSIENVFPNPSSSNVEIEIKDYKPQLTAQILKSNGQLIKTIQLSQKNTSIDIRDLEGGV